MATIAALTEDFDGGDLGTQVTSGNSFIDNTTGTSSGQPTFSANQPLAEDVVSARVALTAQTNLNRCNYTATGKAWFEFYVRLNTLPGSNTALLNWYNDSTKVGDLQVTPDGTLRIRDNNSTQWTSTALGAGWHRVAVRTEPGSATGHQVKIYSGANRDTDTPSQDSGGLTATASSQSQTDNMRWGALSAATLDVQFARFRGDDDTEPGGLPAPEEPEPGGDALEYVGLMFAGGEGGTSYTSWVATLTGAAPVGSTVLGFISLSGVGSNDREITSIVDSEDNDWVVDLQPVRNGTTVQTGIFRCVVENELEAGDTVTFNISPGSNQWGVVLAAFNGVVDQAPLVTASDMDNSTSYSAGTTGSASEPAMLHVAAFGSTIVAHTPGLGFTQIGQGEGTTRKVSAQYRFNPTAGTQTATATGDGSGVWVGVQAVYEATGGPEPDPPSKSHYVIRDGQFVPLEVVTA